MADTHRDIPAPIRPMRAFLIRLLDAFARGASPPGLIDMTPFLSSAGGAGPPATAGAGADSQLRRRFTMIATFDLHHRRNRSWSAAGITLSLALGAVALTGAVRGQESAANPEPAAQPSAPGATPAAARDGDGPGNAPPRPAATPASAKRPLTREEADKLWREKYAKQIIMVNGREVNRDQVDQQYLRELEDAGGVEDPASGRKGRAGGVADGGESAEDRAMAATLARRVPEVNFDAVALSDVVDFLRDVSGANVFVDWGALESAGIERAAPVTARAKNVSLSTALDLVLASAGRGTVALGYGLKDGVIHVATGEMLDRLVETRAYDVRDVVPSEIDMKELGVMVRSAVDPDSWRENGGSVGALHTSKHKMIVTATEPSHRKIREILGMLRDQPRQAKTEEAATAAQGPAAPVR